MNWLQKGSRADSKGDLLRTISLNIGGILYFTTYQALQPLEGHPIFGPILCGRAKVSEDGSYFVDRDGVIFRVIINYLRSNALYVSESFDEWDLLLEETRFYQLTALEELIMRHYGYQRMSFRRELPRGIYVCWPTTVIVREAFSRPSAPVTETKHFSSDNLFTHCSTPDGFQGSYNADSFRGIKGQPYEHESMSRAEDNRKASGNQLAHNALRIVIAPPLPSLEVCSDGRSVRYTPPAHECQNCADADKITISTTEVRATSSKQDVLLIKVEQLVTVLLSAYGYVIQHWNEKEGKIFFSLGS
ncbi:unnamed protein product [Phytomonas sp. EM1]|nr:unnamed protein product [Phytomonas sp. EM1]|eukprot:CCW61238.1 unnamed protein product [Phytomonas sp. isolate EM1]